VDLKGVAQLLQMECAALAEQKACERRGQYFSKALFLRGAAAQSHSLKGVDIISTMSQFSRDRAESEWFLV
jgi:hypothetical protein